MRTIAICLTAFFILLVSCKSSKNRAGVSAFDVVAGQLRYENYDTVGKQYIVTSEPIHIVDSDFEKLSSRINTKLKESVTRLVKNIAKEEVGCRFDAPSDYPFLLSGEDKNVDSKNITGVFSLSCIEYDLEENVGLYYFRYVCGSECGESGFVLFSMDNAQINIKDIIYTGIS